MDTIVSFLEKGQPFFDKVAKNIYVQAIKDGFLSNMAIILSSSLFLLVATIPSIVPVTFPPEVLDFCYKVYNFTMGVVGIMVAGTTASALTVSMNRRMPEGKAINSTSTMITAMCAMMILAVTQAYVAVDGVEGVSVFTTDNMGTKGLLSSIIAAFVTVNIYKVCIIHNLTIRLPKEVPGAIAQSFLGIFAFSFSVVLAALVDTACRMLLSVPFANLASAIFTPLFTAADTYLGMAVVYIATSLFQFVGIHGASVVRSGLNVALYGNTELNLQAFQAGLQPDLAFTEDFSNFIAGMGGSGCTFIVPFILIFFMRSKQLKTVGKASLIPCIFTVNEPLLFGMPIVFNPYLLIPYCIAPVVNAWIGKFFIDVLGMNAAMYVLPWAMPGPIGAIIDSNFQLISVLLVVILLAVDFVIYYPFCKAYDNLLAKEEASTLAEEVTAEIAGGNVTAIEDAPAAAKMIEAAKEAGKQLKVLVLCAGAGTSALLANALSDGAQELGIDNLATNSGAYGSHYDIMNEYDVIVLAPQVRTYYDDMKADTDRLGITLLAPRGKEYIDLTNDPKGAIAWLMEHLEE